MELSRALVVIEAVRWGFEIAVLVGVLIGLVYALVMLKVVGVL